MTYGSEGSRGLRFVLLMALGGSACGPPSSSNGSGLSADDVLRTVDTIRLEEPDGHPITGIDDVAILSDSRLVVVDSKAAQVRLHNATGRFRAIVGGPGEGPGEFRRPLAATALPSGGFLVAGASPDISEFDATGGFVRDLPIPGLGAVELESLPTGEVVFASSDGNTARYYIADTDDWRPSFVHARDSVFSTNEEWRVAVRDYATAQGDGLLIAASLAYPLTRVDLRGRTRTDFGTEPESWIQATRPEPSPAVMQRLPGWLRSFTFVSGLETVSDDWIVVQHARFLESPDDRLATLFAWSPYAFDVYTMAGERILEDVVLPGRLLGTRDSLLYMLTSEPPADWVVAVTTPVLESELR